MANASLTSSPANGVTGKLLGFFAKFTVLKNAMPELWLSFLIKVLVIAAYAVTNSTLVLWFSSDLGYSDEKSLALVGAWSLVMSAMTVLVGSLTDALGLRKTFFLGVGICIFSRLVMVVTTVKWIAICGGLMPLAVGEALTGPVLVAAVRQYSNTKQRSISFSIIYMMMNLGFLLSNYLFDSVRKAVGEYGHWTVPVVGVQRSAYQTLFMVSLGIQIIVWPILFLLREGAEATDKGVKIVPREKKHQDKGIFTAFRLTAGDTLRETGRLLKGLVSQSGFYQLLAFLVLVAFLKLIYRQMDYVYPKYGIRVLGAGAPIGHILAINNWLILLLLPIVGALTQRFSAYRMVVVGGVISAISVFFLTMPQQWFVPLIGTGPAQWFGHSYLGLTGEIHPIYIMSAIFEIVFSIGEAFYSPRVYEYAAAIAPKGQEASYSALSYVPLLLPKLLTGFSGILLAKYCPEVGERHPEMIWIIVGCTACICPIGLLLFHRFIQLKEAGREES